MLEQVSGFPTILLFNDGEFRETYNGCVGALTAKTLCKCPHIWCLQQETLCGGLSKLCRGSERAAEPAEAPCAQASNYQHNAIIDETDCVLQPDDS